jgi:stage II sporulation protein D
MQAVFAGGRVGLAAVIAIAVVAPVRAASAPACDTTIRVLLEVRDSAFGLADRGRTRRFEAAKGGGLRVDGVRRPSWQGGAGASRLGGQRVPGVLSVLPLGGKLALVAEIPLETYVAGVLMGEVPMGWEPAALRAQAVVSRSYGLHQRGLRARRPYHVEANTRDQVFVLKEPVQTLRRAVTATRCEVLTWRGRPILAAYHSASGGRTASSQEVWGTRRAYLRSTEVKHEEDSPDTYWRTRVSRTTIGDALAAIGRGVGDVRAAQVIARSESGRVLEIRIGGSRGETRLSGSKLRTALGESVLKSTLFELTVQDTAFLFVGSGRGHGVGMSQWGAQAMARRGVSYREILERFYPGTKLREWGRHFGDNKEFAGR